MQLKITRSQRTGGIMGSTAIFIVDARVQFTGEEQANITRYKLGGQAIYNSATSAKHLEGARSVDGGTAAGFAKSVYHLAASKMALNITINSLQNGQHIECKSLDEVIGAEEALMEACTALRNYLDTAATFDGREVLIDFTTNQPVVTAQSTSPPPILATPPPAAPQSAAEPLSGPTTPPMLPAPGASAYDYASTAASTPLDAWLERLKRWWHYATMQQRVMAVGGGVVVLYVLYLIF